MDKKAVQDYIFQKSVPQMGSECWLWNGKNPGKRGYATVSIRKMGGPKSIGAHRASYIAFKGDIGEGKEICHTCDTPSCVNPDHLFIGTTKDNAQDRKEKGRNSNRKGQMNHYAKLTDQAALEIRNGKMSGIEASKLFGVSRATVSMIRSGKTWAHLN